jgi:hypothetical protein
MAENVENDLRELNMKRWWKIAYKTEESKFFVKEAQALSGRWRQKLSN